MEYAVNLLLLVNGLAWSGEPVYVWRSRADDVDRVYLYRDGKQVGGWCYRDKHYRTFDGTTWGPPSEAAPVRPPEQRPATMSITRQSFPYRRGLRGRIDAGMDQIMDQIASKVVGPLFQSILDETVNKAMKEFAPGSYTFDLYSSAMLFAHTEMGGKLNSDSEAYRAAQQLMTKGSAGVFLSERAKFVDKLKEDGFSKPVLAMISFDIGDADPRALIGSQEWQVLFNAGDWREAPKTAAADSLAILMLVNRRRAKDANEKTPVTVHCSFDFTTMKEGREVMRTLSFDLYLESLDRGDGDGLGYPWKVRNVRYK